MKRLAFGMVLLIAAPALAQAADGGGVYADTCAMCHQPDGAGIPGTFPALTESEIASGDASSMISFVLGGSGAMPAFSYLSDEDLAAVLSYVRSEFAGATEISEEEVAAER